MKTLTFNASLVAEGNHVQACSNLRLNSDGVLVPVGEHQQVGVRGDIPIGQHTDADGRETQFFVNNLELKAMRDGVTCSVGRLPSAFRTMVTVAEGEIMMMLEDRAVRLVRDSSGAWSMADVAPLHSPLALTAVDASATSVGVDSIPLSGNYDTHSITLNATDISRLGTALVSAYRALDTLTARSARYLQPMLGCYRLLDDAGHEIYRSSPVIVGPSEGINCLTSTTATLTPDGAGGFRAIAPFRIAATPYSVALRLDCAPTDRVAMALLTAAARIEVLLSPQLNPVVPTASPGYRLEHSSSGSRIAIYLPGTSVDMTPQPHLLASTVMGLMSHLDEALTPTFTMQVADAGLVAPGATVMFQRSAIPDFEAERQRVQALVSRRLTTVCDGASQRLTRLCSMPHTFTAATAFAAGSILLMGNITTRLFDGYTPCEMARTVVRGSGCSSDARVKVSADDIVESHAADDAAPATLSPLLCYPLTTASRMCISATGTDGILRHFDIPLATVPGCEYAFYLNPSLLPLDIVAEGRAGLPNPLPAASGGVAVHPGAIVSADIASPFSPCDAMVATSGCINAIAPAIRAVNGWGFSRLRYYLFSSEGVMSVSVDSGKARFSAPSLLSEGCAPGLYAIAADKLYAVVGGALLSFAGGRAVRHIARGVTAVGYCSRYKELWVKTLGETRIYTPDMKAYYTRPMSDAYGFTTLAGHLYYTRAGGVIYDASVELPSEQPIIWISRMRVERGFRPVVMDGQLQGSVVNGALTLHGDGGAGVTNSRLLTRLSVNGAVDAPLLSRVLAPCRPYITAELNANVSADFSLSSIIITLRS